LKISGIKNTNFVRELSINLRSYKKASLMDTEPKTLPEPTNSKHEDDVKDLKEKKSRDRDR